MRVRFRFRVADGIGVRSGLGLGFCMGLGLGMCSPASCSSAAKSVWHGPITSHQVGYLHLCFSPCCLIVFVFCVRVRVRVRVRYMSLFNGPHHD